MILIPLVFEWNVCEDEGVVGFVVRQHTAHSIHERYYSRGRIPPISERIRYQRALGASEETVKKIIKNHKSWQKNTEKNQKILDDTFARFNIKPTKKKILKPVKKN